MFLLPIKASSNIIGALHAKKFLPSIPLVCIFSLEKLSQDEKMMMMRFIFMRYFCDLGSMNSSTNHTDNSNHSEQDAILT